MKKCQGIRGAFSKYTRLSTLKIPELALIRHSHGNCLGGVDYRAAAHGNHRIYALGTGKVDAFVHEVVFRVRLYAAETHGLDAGVGEIFLDASEQAGADSRAAALNYQNFFHAEGCGEFADPAFRIAPEHIFGGRPIGEIFHSVNLL